METIGLFEAKTHLSAIIEKVRKGEHFTITHRGKPVAQLQPVEPIEDEKVAKRKAAIAYIKSIKRAKLPKGYTIKKMIEEGRM